LPIFHYSIVKSRLKSQFLVAVLFFLSLTLSDSIRVKSPITDLIDVL
jgi:hypothetical protein